MAAVWCVYSMVAFAMPVDQSGEITVSGQVTVNGQPAVSSSTILSGAVIVTLAPATGLPFGSVTIPLIDADPDCASATFANTTKRRDATSSRINLCMGFLH